MITDQRDHRSAQYEAVIMHSYRCLLTLNATLQRAKGQQACSKQTSSLLRRRLPPPPLQPTAKTAPQTPRRRQVPPAGKPNHDGHDGQDHEPHHQHAHRSWQPSLRSLMQSGSDGAKPLSEIARTVGCDADRLRRIMKYFGVQRCDRRFTVGASAALHM